MLQRTTIRTRVLAGFAVPVLALVVVGALNLGPSLGLGIVIAAVTGAAIMLAIAITASITRPISALTAQVVDLNVMQRLGRKVLVDEMLPPRDHSAGFDGELGQLSNAIAEGRRRGLETVKAERDAHDAIKALASTCATRTDVAIHSATQACATLLERVPGSAISETLESLQGFVLRSERHNAGLLELLGANTLEHDRATSVAAVIAHAVRSCEAAERVDIVKVADAYLVSSAVNDMAILLGELIDNAITATSNGGSVSVSGEPNDVGYLVVITNDGDPMDHRARDLANKRISRSTSIDLLPTKSIGLDVVGNIARRHEIGVQVSESAGGATALRVQIPWASLTFAPAIPPVAPTVVDVSVIVAAEVPVVIPIADMAEVPVEPETLTVDEAAFEPELIPAAEVDDQRVVEVAPDAPEAPPVVLQPLVGAGVATEVAVSTATVSVPERQESQPVPAPVATPRPARTPEHRDSEQAEAAPRKKRWAAALANAER